MNAHDKAKHTNAGHGAVHPAKAHMKADGAKLHARAAAHRGTTKRAAAGHAISRLRLASHHPPA